MVRNRTHVLKSLVLMLALCCLVAPGAASAQDAAPATAPRHQHLLDLTLQRRNGETGEAQTTSEKVPVGNIGIVIVDPWNFHWCKTAAERVGALMPRMNRALDAARKLGILVMFAPTDVADMYAGTPQYEAAAALPRYELPQKVEIPDPKLRGGGCMCGPGNGCPGNYGWDAMHPALQVCDGDLIVSGPIGGAASTQRLHAICQDRGLTHLIYMGVHTNMCVTGKGVGMLPIARSGLSLILARDLTDALTEYDPTKPYTPDDGTAEVIRQIEARFAPTIDMLAEMREAGACDATGPTDPVRIAPWGTLRRAHQFDTSTIVTLTFPQMPQAQIRYTVDGSEPGADSLLYGAPINVADTTTLRAVACVGSELVSLPSEGYFVRLAPRPPKPDVCISDLEAIRAISANQIDGYSTIDKGSARSPEMDGSIDPEGELKLRGVSYAKGVGVQAPSQLLYAIEPRYARFVGLAGVDETLLKQESGRNLAMHPNVVFRVSIDGVRAAESPVMRISQEPWRFDVRIPEGAKTISLVAMDAGGGNAYDLANWVDAGFVLKKEETEKPRDRELRVAVVTGGHDFEQPPFAEMFDSMQNMKWKQFALKDESEIFENIDGWDYDVVVLYNLTQQITEQRRENLLTLLERGVGLVVLHHALASFQDWPEYGKIVGGKYYFKPTVDMGRLYEPSTWKHGLRFGVQVSDPTHPVTRDLEDFEILDETYKGYSVAPDVRILLETEEPSSERALAWTKDYRNARVVALQLGHDGQSYADPHYRGFLGEAIRYAAHVESVPLAPARPPVQYEGSAPAPESDMAWWYREAAKQFSEALPIGTGRLGAMVWGDPRDERIVFNDETLWAGGPCDPNNPKGAAALAKVRQLTLEGKHAEAEAAAADLIGIPSSVQPYQPMGELRLDFEGQDAVQDYRRELDMGSGVVRVSYMVGDAYFTRETFASYPDQAIVTRITCDKPGRLSFRASMASPQPGAHTKTIGYNTLVLSGATGQAPQGASGENAVASQLQWQARLRIVTPDETLVRAIADPNIKDAATSACLTVGHTQSVTLLLTAATNYRRWNDVGSDAAGRCERVLESAGKRSWHDLLRRHANDFEALFSACRLDLPKPDTMDLDTTARLARIRSGVDDPQFVAQYFQYARYLLLAASRPRTLAYNTSSIWQDESGGGWALNGPLEQCYWPAEVTNLAECNDALLLFARYLADAGQRTAKELYGCRGWCAHAATDVWMNTAPSDSPAQGLFPTAGAWVLQNLWEHYRYDPNRDYLKELYPLMRGASEFFLDYLIEEPGHSWLLTCPSTSPERRFATAEGAEKTGALCAGPALDSSLLRDLFANTIEAAETLGVDADLCARLKGARAQLPPHQIGRWGQLQEWLDDLDDPQDKHSGLAHLYGLYPSDQIAPGKTPDLARAALTSLEASDPEALGRLGAWKIGLYARQSMAEPAYAILKRMLTAPSGTSIRVPAFQGDQGLQAAAAGIAEMLLQSQGGVLHFLPALPKAWPHGSIEGLRARGGYMVHVQWQNGRLSGAQIYSKHGGPCRVRGPELLKMLSPLKDGATVRKIDDTTFEFDAEAGQTYQIGTF